MTIEAAVERILAGLSATDKDLVRSKKRGDLIQFHHGWGTQIQNSLGLWKGNLPLLLATGTLEPDSSSMKIIERVWEALNAPWGTDGNS